MSSINEAKIREEICEIHRWLHEKGFSVANDGNTSMRIDEKHILVTPAGVEKALMKPDDLVVLDLDGNHIRGEAEATSEWRMHVAAYQARPDVRAVLHAHPPYCIALTLAGVSMAEATLPEVIISVGRVPTVPYARPGTREFSQAARKLLTDYDCLIFERHGTLTVSRNLHDCVVMLERLEHAAKIMSIAKAVGPVKPLPKEEEEALLALRKKKKKDQAGT